MVFTSSSNLCRFKESKSARVVWSFISNFTFVACINWAQCLSRMAGFCNSATALKEVIMFFTWLSSPIYRSLNRKYTKVKHSPQRARRRISHEPDELSQVVNSALESLVERFETENNYSSIRYQARISLSKARMSFENFFNSISIPSTSIFSHWVVFQSSIEVLTWKMSN